MALNRYEYPRIPESLEEPLRFREPGGQFEGTVKTPWELIERFEPVDVLNGATEVCDDKGTCIKLMSQDPKVLSENQYFNKADLYLEVDEMPNG